MRWPIVSYDTKPRYTPLARDPTGCNARRLEPRRSLFFFLGSGLSSYPESSDSAAR